MEENGSDMNERFSASPPYNREFHNDQDRESHSRDCEAGAAYIAFVESPATGGGGVPSAVLLVDAGAAAEEEEGGGTGAIQCTERLSAEARAGTDRIPAESTRPPVLERSRAVEEEVPTNGWGWYAIESGLADAAARGQPAKPMMRSVVASSEDRELREVDIFPCVLGGK